MFFKKEERVRNISRVVLSEIFLIKFRSFLAKREINTHNAAITPMHWLRAFFFKKKDILCKARC